MDATEGAGPARARLVLASASPRRRDLLGLVGRPFDVDPADVDESIWPDEAPLDYVARVAEAKAAVGTARHPGRLVIAADTTVALGGEILAKPEDAADAVRMLRALSGRAHEVHTHVVVALEAPSVSRGAAVTVSSSVVFDELDDADIAAYVASGEPLDKAGAYAIQGGAAGFVREVRGSITGIVGLPLVELRALLRDADTWAPAVRDAGRASGSASG